ncbi:hypothetical protein RCL1_002329 [Eukaryota sp. TZLM3-RCL]
MPKDVLDLEAIYHKAESLYNVLQVSSSKTSKSDKYLKSLSTDGTFEDRISSLSLKIAEAPQFCLEPLSSLIDLLTTSRRSAQLSVITALSELFSDTLLLSDVSLIPFYDRKLKGASDDDLITWYYEDKLKQFFMKFLTHLKTLSTSPLYHHKKHTLQSAFNLASNCSEQLPSILLVISLRLGDVDRRVCSLAADKLLKLCKADNSKLNKTKLDRLKFLRESAVDSVFQVLSESNLSKSTGYHAKLFGVHFLSCLEFLEDDSIISEKIMKVYGLLLGSLLNSTDRDTNKEKKNKKKNGKKVKSEAQNDENQSEIGSDLSSRSRILLLLLKGIQNCVDHFGHLSHFFDLVLPHLDNLFKLVHFAPLPTVGRILMLIKSLIAHQQAQSNLIGVDDCKISDRFYRTLYQSLLRPEILDFSGSSRLSVFLNLIYQCIRDDSNPIRALAFCNRLLGLAVGCCNVSFIISVLIILSEVSKSSPEVLSLINTSEKEIVSVLQSRLTSEDQISRKVLSFDPYARDPRSSGLTSLWALDLLSNHFHPTVSLFVETLKDLSISKGKSSKFIEYDGDPGRDFALLSFLNKFSIKNPSELSSESRDQVKSVSLSLGDASKALRKFFETTIPRERIDSKAHNDDNFDNINDPDDGFDSEIERELLAAVEAEEKEINQKKRKKGSIDDSDSDCDSQSEHSYDELMDDTGAIIGGYSDVEEEDLIDFGNVEEEISQSNINESSSFADIDDFKELFGDDVEVQNDEESVKNDRKRRTSGKSRKPFKKRR